MIGMEEIYPRTVLELEDRFATEDDCRDYLGRLRWPDGFVCPRCGHHGGWPATRGRLIFQRCRHQASVTAGTIFQDTHKPLRLWFRAIWQVTSQKHGASAVSVQQVLGLGSYLTAWTWLHKLRRAMVRPGRDRLAGRVEVDETYVGGESEGKVGRGTDKALVVIAVEEDGAGMGRIRMGRITTAAQIPLHRFIQASIQPGSTIHTDGNSSYIGLEAIGYAHEATVLKGREKDAATELLPRVHLVVSLLKRWLLGTHQGAVRPNYLDYYLDEFTFRFNRRTSRSRGKLFHRLLQQAMQVEPVPYRSIVTDAANAPQPQAVGAGGVN
jgi:transposase-like protein